jgi:D-alanyl-D-alanine carboxypeptidase
MPDLEEVLATVEPSSAEQIRARPQVFLELVAEMLAAPEALHRLVDKQHALESDYGPDDPVALERYPITTNRTGHRLSRLIMPDLLAMIEAARAAGIELMVSSAYRSYDYQAGVYNRHVEKLGTAAADRVSARPGHSQHQLGTTIDFGSIAAGYGETPNGRWVAAHAWRFGFSLSYPAGQAETTGYDYEPWHFRYLGRVGTLLEREFFGSLQQRFLEFFAEWSWWFELRRHAP